MPMHFIKIIQEVLNMAKQLSDTRFDVLMKLFWGCVTVAGGYVLLFGLSAFITAIRWW